MSADNKTYWKSLEEYEQGGPSGERAAVEFVDTPLRDLSEPGRRDFLRAAGFAFAGAALTGCGRAPVERVIPMLRQPEGITPGRPYYYAAVCGGCSASCGVLSKCRDGRPIKLEGNPEHPVSKGGLCAVGQASLLGLYDSLRLQQAMARGRSAPWREVDAEISRALDSFRKQRRAVRVLTQTITGPALSSQISTFLASFQDARHVVYDVLSASPILDAHLRTHGARVLPRYLFTKAAVIASFDADFLGTWISPVEFTAAYSAARDVDAQPARSSWHIQFESRMSLTGTKADRRIKLAPAEIPAALEHLAVRIARKAGSAVLPGAGSRSPAPEDVMDDLATRLWNARGRSLVVCGLASTDAQVLCNLVNHLLGNYGSTLDVDAPSNQKQGNDRELMALVDEIKAGGVAALFIHGLNPVADLPGGEELARSLARVPLLVSLAPHLDETSSLARYLCPARDPLETWGDSEPVAGVAAISQPAIRPLGQARPAIESFARWSGVDAPAYELVKGFWKERVYPRQERQQSFDVFWKKSVEVGFALVKPQSPTLKPFDLSVVKPIDVVPPSGNGLALVLYANVAMPDGRHAYNPWLQELPDPVTKAVWDNYASLAPATAERLSLKNGDVVRLEASGTAIELPVLIQPGQHEQVVAVALGYGRSVSARFAGAGPKWLERRPTLGPNGKVGVNAAPLIGWENGAVQYWPGDVKVTSAGKRQLLAVTQDHHSLTVPKHLDPGGGPRPIVQETTLGALHSGEAKHEGAHTPSETDLWPDDHPFTGHRWAMAIDLNACTGCSACVIACQVENNVPVTGKDEVLRNREMHWIRIDRYYSGPPDDVEVAHQPMMCQHCEHAPCETVCPVLATVHSAEGLSQQIYNRCVGTRYCANNCPFKTRRFNWFEYSREDRLANLALNPDVTVRSRGVMEKCSFCVQRIQDARAEAKRQNRALRDGEIQTACQQSCSAKAILFGDLNDPKSKVTERMKSKRTYRVLEELNVRPSVGYLKIVRHHEPGKGEGRHG
ncbi:MAG TPA: Fe-S-cluster-containing hydrogenase [Bryobacteraceae bacterium]|nr:Fe-S-cluster-containing hydrogenase [Bryobacteraceae bacterium]